ncbi:hypothetical protein BKI52_18485 [marine bacterium AO1-C]|nr:hypothetical protein BKI52_18485 [marine bacterium AO1-C]
MNTAIKYFEKTLRFSYWCCLYALSLQAQSQQSNRYADTLVNYQLQIAKDSLQYSLSSGLLLAKEVLELAIQKNDQLGVAMAHGLVGKAYLEETVHERALHHFLEQLNILKKIKKWQELANTYNQIAILYRRQQQYKNTIRYSQFALDLAKKYCCKQEVGLAYINTGAAYYFFKDYPKALQFFQLSVSIRETLQDTIGLVHSYNNVGLALRKLKQSSQALKWYKKSLKVNQGKREVKQMKSATLDNIGDLMADAGKHSTARKYYLEALEIAKKSKKPLRTMEAFESLFLLARKEQKYKKALDYYTQYMRLKNKFINANVDVKMKGIRQVYEIDSMKKERDFLKKNVALKQAAIERQVIITISTVVGLTLVLLLAIVLYRSKAILKNQKAEITTQNKALLQTQEEILAQQNIINESNQKLLSQKLLIDQSIKAASTIQEAILPSQERMAQTLKNYFVINRPKDIVSGDFYWLGESEGNPILGVIDCTGHGVPGAFMSMISFAMLNEIINTRQITAPAEILECLRVFIRNTLKQNGRGGERGMDAAFITYQYLPDDLVKVDFAGAKRPLWYAEPFDKTMRVIKGSIVSVGVNYKTIRVIESQSFVCQRGSMLYLSTDGFTDQNNKHRVKFSAKRFVSLLAEIKGLPLPHQQQWLNLTLNTYMQDTEQRDDILMLGVHL